MRLTQPFLLLLLGSAAACGRLVPSAQAPSADVASAPAAGEPPWHSFLPTCNHTGPFSCDVPLVHGNPCDALDACVPEPAFRDPQLVRNTECTVVATGQPAPGPANVRGVQVVKAARLGASAEQFNYYLLAEYASGFCLLDQLTSIGPSDLARHSYEFALSWRTSDAKVVLEVSNMHKAKMAGAPDRKFVTTYGLVGDRFDPFWDMPL